jgi:hypothetical protein
VKNISKIGVRYLKNDFIYDFLPLIPFNALFSFRYSRLLFLVKCLRLLETFEMLDTGAFMRRIKKVYEKRLDKICEDPKLAEDTVLDQNKILTIIMIGYIFKTVKLIIIIFQVSYFLGIGYYIYCDVTDDLWSVVVLDYDA